MPAVVKNIVSDFGAVGDGTTDNIAAFMAFNDWATNPTTGWQATNTGLIELDIPAGTFGMVQGATDRWASGIKQLIVVGAGQASSSLLQLGGGNLFLGGQDPIAHTRMGSPTGVSARLAQANIGATTVTLLDPSLISLFVVGRYALIGGFDTQGNWLVPFGYPPNPHYFDYVKITAVSSPTVTFDTPLRYTYKTTWPSMNSGSSGADGPGASDEADPGGPATIYALHSTFDTEVEYQDLTITNSAQQTFAQGRSATFTQVTFAGSNGGIPTQNILWRAVDCDLSSYTMEVDKLIGTIDILRGSVGRLRFQSSSTDLLSMNGVTITDKIEGTPKKAILTNCIGGGFEPGCIAFGRTDEVICDTCSFSEITPKGIFTDGTGPADTGLNNRWTMSGGVIIIPNTDSSSGADQNQVRFAVPGTVFSWNGVKESERMARVIDVTQDATNTYVQTNQTGGFPNVPLTSGKLFLSVLPTLRATFTNCTGCPDAIDLSQAPPGAPMYSYSKRTYAAGAADGTAQLGMSHMWGALKHIKIDVTKAYTGVLSDLFFYLSNFRQWPVLLDDNTLFNYDAVIDLKVPGVRTIIPGLTTGAVGNDATLDLPSVWFVQGVGPKISADITGESSSVFPSVTVEIATDQGIIPLAVAPLRLRLRS